MMRGIKISGLLVVLMLGVLVSRAAAQSVGPGEPMNPAEHAYVERYHDTWQNLNPDQRQRVLQNLRKWQQMTPDERGAAQSNFEQFRRLPPDQKRAGNKS